MEEPTLILIALVAGTGCMVVGGILWFIESRNNSKAINNRFDRLQ